MMELVPMDLFLVAQMLSWSQWRWWVSEAVVGFRGHTAPVTTIDVTFSLSIMGVVTYIGGGNGDPAENTNDKRFALADSCMVVICPTPTRFSQESHSCIVDRFVNPMSLSNFFCPTRPVFGGLVLGVVLTSIVMENYLRHGHCVLAWA